VRIGSGSRHFIQTRYFQSGKSADVLRIWYLTFVSKILIKGSYPYVGCFNEDGNILSSIFLILQNPTSFIGNMSISEKVALEPDDVVQILDFSEVFGLFKICCN
jgi:hypothetical protein